VRDHTSLRAAALATLPADTMTDSAPAAPLAGVALHGLWPGKRLAPSTALADPLRVLGDDTG
jgi:hypothetical protein